MNQPNVSRHAVNQPTPTPASASACHADPASRPASTSRIATSPCVSGRNRDTQATGHGYADSGTLTPHSVITVTRPTLAATLLSQRNPSNTPPRKVPKQYADAPTSTVRGTTSRVRGHGMGSPNSAPISNSAPSAETTPSPMRYVPREASTTTGLVGLATSNGSVPALRSQLTMLRAHTPSIAASITALPTS